MLFGTGWVSVVTCSAVLFTQEFHLTVIRGPYAVTETELESANADQTL